jgi:hypothetical protein
MEPTVATNGLDAKPFSRRRQLEIENWKMEIGNRILRARRSVRAFSNLKFPIFNFQLPSLFLL